MIFLDTNILLRFITVPQNDHAIAHQESTRVLFRQIEAAAVQATFSEVVLHQATYLLAAKRHYNAPVPDIVETFRIILGYAGITLSTQDREIYLRAFDLWEGRPSLGFADCLIVARCERNGWELATFDQALGRLPTIAHWQPVSG